MKKNYVEFVILFYSLFKTNIFAQTASITWPFANLNKGIKAMTKLQSLTIMFLLTFLFGSTAHAQWMPTGLTNGTINIVFSNGSNLLAGMTNGALISTDNGTNWNYTSINTSFSVWSFAVYGTDIFAGTTGGFLRSTDNGATWNPVNSGMSLVQSFATIGTNFFIGTESGGVYLSTDGGTTWAQLNSGLTNLTVRAITASGTNLFAGTNGSGIFLSTDNGTNWTPINTGLTALDVRGFAGIGSYVFAGTSGGVFRTGDNGANWINVRNDGLIRGLAVACGTDLFVGHWYNGGGVARSVDNGTTWTTYNTGLTTSTVPTLTVNGSNIFAGTWNGGVFSSPTNCATIDSTGSICGIKFNDLNGNGIQDSGELGLANWVINLKFQNAAGFITITDTTDANGNYCFNDLQPGGTYTVFETNQSGWTQTSPPSPGIYTILLTSGEHRDSVNFGNKLLPVVGSICGIKFNDLNGNGIQDPGELGLANWIINLKYQNAAGFITITDTTDANGNYCFNDLQPGGTYTVFETNQSGWQQTSPPSPGTYTIPLTSGEHKDSVDFGNKLLPVVGSICGIKFNDLNGNGVQDPGELGLANWVINLKFQNAAGFITLTDTTDANGNYCFNNLQPGGTYTVFETNQSGWTQTSPPSPGTYTILLTSGEHRDSVNFGNKQLPVVGSICGIKFNDLNGNGVQDPGELGLANWVINLKFQNAAGFITITDTTDTNGNYCFNDLQPGGTYTVFETNQSGWTQTSPPSPGTYTIPLTSGEHRDSVNFGNKLLPVVGSICGIKFNDLNGNGVQDPGEIGLANWVINLKFQNAAGFITITDTTDANGNYCFNDLQPGGTYTVFETNQSGWTQTSPTSPGTYTIPLTSGEYRDSVDFGNKLLPVVGSICGIKFNDLNGNGVQDPGELGLANWIINLKYQNAAGFITITDTTDANGNYCFNDIQPGGTYTVFETNQSGWTQTSPPSPGTYTILLSSGEHRDSINFGNQLSTVGSICDSLHATVTKSVIGDCCWSISLNQPSNTSGITGIQFWPLSPNTFALGSSQLGSSYSIGWLFATNTINQFTVKRLTGNVPAGPLPNFFNFCMNNLSSPQYVVVNWLNANNNVVCSDTVTLDCEIPCVTFSKDTVICNTNDYTLQYSFTNNATYAVNKIEVVQTVPAGIIITPSTLIIPSVNPGQSSGVLTFSISGALPNTTVAIHFRFTSSDSCCFCTDILFVTTPSCMCEEVGATLNEDSGNCSDTLNISNGFSGNYFTQINLTALPSGTVFSNWNTNTSSNWYSLNTFAANSIHLINIGNGFIPSGNSNGILDFILSGYTTSTQKIVVEWIRNDSVKCVDTLTTHCVPPPPTMYCTQLIDDSLVCLPNGTFQYKFKVKNNSTDSTTGFQLNAISPSTFTFSPSNFSNVAIGPSMVSPEQTVIISGISPNTQFCFDIALYKHIMQHDTLYSWCCHSDTVCTTTPNCGPKDSAEACITWNLLSTQLVTSTNGNINGSSETISTGSSSPFMAILSPYTSNGQRLLVLGGWPVGSLDLNRFIEFQAGPNLGNSFTVKNVSFNFGDNPQTTDYNIINSQVFYSTNNFSSSSALGGTLAYLNTTMSTFTVSNLNIFVANGQTFSLRIYPYSPTGSITATVSLAIHNNVVICGTTSAITSVDDGMKGSAIPESYQLEQNYPNPFNPSSTIRYDIPKTSFVKISVYDMLGREIKVLVNEEKNPGRYEIVFDAKELASGIYFYAIRTGEFTQNRKMILMK
ncbi:MAG: T9SS type A sorting domain-containing protein [Ignavibacteriaceae bacterium]|nr:T9SS type A sorting domain-containing protein [Ignavibacteriaceae bacterium]